MSITLGKGALEVDIPSDMYDPDLYVWTDIVALFTRDDRPGQPNDLRVGYDVEFSTTLIGQTGTLVATVTETRDITEPTRRVRQDAPVPPVGSEVVLGTGIVRIRTRKISDKLPAPGRRTENTGIGVGHALDGAAVRSVMNQRVTLELR